MGITRSRLRFPSPALILACLALFAALGGSTYAATSISSTSVHFQNAALKNGWMRSGNTAPAGYAKDSAGIVHLRGGIAGGSGLAFVLPKALRPNHVLYLSIVAEGPTAAYLQIKRNGDVIPNGSSGLTGFTGLDGVSFAAGE